MRALMNALTHTGLSTASSFPDTRGQGTARMIGPVVTGVSRAYQARVLSADALGTPGIPPYPARRERGVLWHRWNRLPGRQDLLRRWLQMSVPRLVPCFRALSPVCPRDRWPSARGG